MVILETERLVLRKFTPDDAPELAPILETITYQEYKHLSLLEYAQGFIEYSIMPSYEQNGFGLWAVVYKPTEQRIGFCGLHAVEVSGKDKVELAYRIAREYRNKGLATEAARAVLTYGLNELKLDEIVSCIRHDNSASIKVALKAGLSYAYDGQFRGKPCKVYQVTKGSGAIDE